MRIYLAGPLFTAAEWQWNSQLARALTEAGYEVFLPQEHGAKYIDEAGEISDPLALFHDNISAIEKADAIVAILDGADTDSGTAWEIGYAFAKRKVILGVRTDFRRSGDTEADLNLMLAESVTSRLLVRNPAVTNSALVEQLSNLLETES